VPLGPIGELSKSQAKLKLRTYLEEQGVNSVAHVVKPAPKPVPAWTFADQAAWWEKNKLALLSQSFQDSRGIYLKQHLVPYFGPTVVSAISEQQAQEFIAHLTRRELAPSTISSITSTLKAIVGEKVWRDWKLTLPRASDKEQRYFTPDEMRQIVEAAKGQWKPLFALLAEIGARSGEAFGLHVEDLDILGCKIHIRRSVYKGTEGNTKTRRGMRVVDISPEVAQMLKDHLRGRTSGRVFQSRNGTPLQKDNVRHSLHRILEKLRIPKGGLHAFRHGRVSVLQESGVPADLIKAWVGHSSLRTTSRYTHFEAPYRQSDAQRVSIFAKQLAKVEAQLPFGPQNPVLDPTFSAKESRNGSVQVALA
jgi:integrase